MLKDIDQIRIVSENPELSINERIETIPEMHSHLVSRGLRLDRYTGISVTSDSVTFPLWNLSGQMVGYQVYRPDKPKNHDGHPRDQRYYTFVSRYAGKTPEIATWGTESLVPSAPTFLLEGIFDACKLHNLGFSAIATLGNDPKHLRPWLRCLPGKKIAVVEGDAAGQRLAKYGDVAVFLPNGLDAGKMSETELFHMLEKFQ